MNGNRLELALILVFAESVAQAADVVPTLHHTGIGSRLINAVIQAMSQGRFDGMLVKANPDAQEFFSTRGLQPLPATNARCDYPFRFWRDVRAD